MHDILKQRLRIVPDFPKPGIQFYDITTVLSDGALFKDLTQAFLEPFRNSSIDLVCGIESRGFIFGAAVAYALGTGFVPIRKPGKLPHKTRRQAYSLEYGQDALEIHDDALTPHHRVLLVDDVLATGGTAQAAKQLIEASGCTLVGATFLLELISLGGRKKLEGVPVHRLLEVA